MNIKIVYAKGSDLPGKNWPDSGIYPVKPSKQAKPMGPALSGRTLGQATCGTYNPSNTTKTLCTLTLRNVPAFQPSTQNFRTYRQIDNYNTKPFAYLQAPIKDVTAYVRGHYDLLNNVTFTANAAYVRDESTQVLYPDGAGVKVGFSSPNTDNGKKSGIAASNPHNPFGVNIVASSTDPCLATGNCIGLGLIWQSPVEAGPRVSDFNRAYFRVPLGPLAPNCPTSG